MIPSVTVYGFGAHFVEDRTGNDIDLLLIHDDISHASCALANRCKADLAKSIDDAHITVLSKREEQFFEFIRTAQAKELGTIRGLCVEDDLDRVCKALTLT